MAVAFPVAVIMAMVVIAARPMDVRRSGCNRNVDGLGLGLGLRGDLGQRMAMPMFTLCMAVAS